MLREIRILCLGRNQPINSSWTSYRKALLLTFNIHTIQIVLKSVCALVFVPTIGQTEHTKLFQWAVKSKLHWFEYSVSCNQILWLGINAIWRHLAATKVSLVSVLISSEDSIKISLEFYPWQGLCSDKMLCKTFSSGRKQKCSAEILIPPKKKKKKMNEKLVLKRCAVTMKQYFPLFHSDLPQLYFL